MKDIEKNLDNLKIQNNNNVKANEDKNNIINYNGYGKYKCKDYPSVLSSITSDFDTLINDNESKKNYEYDIKDFPYYIKLG